MVCGFPAVGRGRIDLLAGSLLFDSWPLGLAAALTGWLLAAWGGVWIVQRWVFPEPQVEMVLDVALVEPPPRDVTRAELLALMPLLAWCLGNWCVPWPGAAGKSDGINRESMTSQVVSGLREPRQP
jgi:hypothetical protein